MNKKLKLELIKLSKKYNLDLFILFGSRANKTNNKNSDWDFAYLKKNKLNYDENQNFLIDLMNILNNEDIDLIDLLNNDNIILLNEIFEKGILIYEIQEGLFENLSAQAWFNFQFYKKSFDLANKNLKNELLNI